MNEMMTLPTEEEYASMVRQAQTLVDSGFFSKSLKTPQQVLAVMAAGRELGLSPMAAVQNLYIVDGKVTMSSAHMLGRIYKAHPGCDIIIDARIDGCFIRARRPGKEWHEISFTMDDAKCAELLGKQNWRMYPRAMYRARAVSEMARTLFPDVLFGSAYTPEEMGAVVDEDERPIGLQAPEHAERRNPMDAIIEEEQAINPPAAVMEEIERTAENASWKKLGQLAKTIPDSWTESQYNKAYMHIVRRMIELAGNGEENKGNPHGAFTYVDAFLAAEPKARMSRKGRGVLQGELSKAASAAGVDIREIIEARHDEENGKLGVLDAIERLKEAEAAAGGEQNV